MKYVFLCLLLLSFALSQVANAANKASMAPSPTKSHSAKQKQYHQTVGVWLHSLDVSYYQDLDNDGYFQNLRLDLDLDTNAAHQDVFVEVWIAAYGAADELLYRTTEIGLYSDASSDAQRIDLQLIEPYDADYYQIELRVIDASTNAVIFTVDQYDSDKLQDAPLEGQRSDQDQNVSIYSANVDLRNDSNSNGFYHQLSVTFDADVTFGSAELIAEIYVDQQLIYTSHSFVVRGSLTSDKQYFDIEMVSGLASGYYDLDIHLIDAHDFARRHHISALDWVVFRDLPLESFYWDNFYEDEIEVHVEHSAGSVGWLLLGLFGLGIMRRLSQNKAPH